MEIGSRDGILHISLMDGQARVLLCRTTQLSADAARILDAIALRKTI